MSTVVDGSMRCAAAAWLLVTGLVHGSAGATPEPTLAEEAAFRAAVDRVAAAVVRIEPAVDAGASSTIASGASTGLVVDPQGLIVATEFAVPAQVAEVVVSTSTGARRVARVLGRDRVRGVVLLETPPLPAAPPLDAAPRGGLRQGQWAIAVGRGWAADQPGVSVGIVSATERCWGLAVQTDASVSPMNYGGPLVDIAGRVIGVIVPLPADTAGMHRGSDLYDSGIGFAIPLEDLLPLVASLRTGAVLEPGLLGLAWTSRDSLNGAPVIGAVSAGSPAAAAGLAAGDRIVAVSGRGVSRAADVRHALAPLHAGERVVIEVERSGGAVQPERRAVTVTLAARLAPARRGVLGIVAGASDDATRIAWLLPDGPAAAAGAAVGDTVASIGTLPAGEGTPLEAPTPRMVSQFVAGLPPGRRVRLELDRGGTRLPLDLELAAPPGDVPAEGPSWLPSATAVDGLGEPVKLIRLEAVESSARPLAVVPRSAGDPLGVLVHFGAPHGAVTDDEAATWRAAVAATGVAVVLPGSADSRRWSRDDIPGVVGAIQALAGRRRIDPDRLAISGSGAGGSFAWLVAERLGAACRGIAVVDAPLPAAALPAVAGPGEARWIMLGGGPADRRRLEDAGHVVGQVPDDGLAPATLCRWVSLLGLL